MRSRDLHIRAHVPNGGGGWRTCRVRGPVPGHQKNRVRERTELAKSETARASRRWKQSVWLPAVGIGCRSAKKNACVKFADLLRSADASEAEPRSAAGRKLAVSCRMLLCGGCRPTGWARELTNFGLGEWGDGHSRSLVVGTRKCGELETWPIRRHHFCPAYSISRLRRITLVQPACCGGTGRGRPSGSLTKVPLDPIICIY